MIMMVRAMQRKDRAERIANPNFVKIGGFRNAGSCVHSLCMHMHMESQNELVIAGHVRRHDEEGDGALWSLRPSNAPPTPTCLQCKSQPTCVFACYSRTYGSRHMGI